MADLSMTQELQNHVGGLVWLTGFLGMVTGVLLMAAYNYFKGRLKKIEDRQENLREEVIPNLITRDDLKEIIGVLKDVGQAFVDRVEKFMTSCHSGECSMALYIKGQLLPHSRPPHHRKEGS